MIGNPEQRLRAFTKKQEAAIAVLSPAEQKIVKKSGFATRPQPVRPGTSLYKHFRLPSNAIAFAVRGSEGFKTTRTGIVTSGGLWGLSELTGARGTEIARHEVAHQVLAPRALTADKEHAIISGKTKSLPVGQEFGQQRVRRKKARRTIRKLGGR